MFPLASMLATNIFEGAGVTNWVASALRTRAALAARNSRIPTESATARRVYHANAIGDAVQYVRAANVAGTQARDTCMFATHYVMGVLGYAPTKCAIGTAVSASLAHVNVFS